MASEPFFYLYLCCWTLAVDILIPTDRTAFGIRTWPRLVLHVGLRLVFFGGDGVWAKCHSNINLAMPRLAWLVFCWRRPFVLFNEDAFLCDPAQKKKKKKTVFADLFRSVGGGFVRIPRNPYSYALLRQVKKSLRLLILVSRTPYWKALWAIVVLSHRWKKFSHQSRHQSRKKRSHVSTKRSNKKTAKTLPPDRSSRLVSLFEWLLVLQIGQRDTLLGPKIGNIMKFGE